MVAPERSASPSAPSAPPPVRPALGKPLRELPPEAAPFVTPADRDGGSGSSSGPALPVVQRQTQDAATPSAPSPQRAGGQPERGPAEHRATERQRSAPGTAPTPVQPAPASPVAPSARPAHAPAPRTPGAQARIRGGLGAPLSALPPTAGTASDAPLLGDPRRVRPGPAAPQTPHRPGAAPATPATPAPAAMPLRAQPGTTPGAQPGQTPAGPAGPSASPAQPAAVQRAAVDTGGASPPPGAVAPVRVRRITSRGPGGQAPGPATPGTGSGPDPLIVQRSRALLAGRTLAVRTGAAEGFSAPPSAAATRPVVPATWRRDTPRPADTPRPESHQDTRTTPAAPRTRATPPAPVARHTTVQRATHPDVPAHAGPTTPGAAQPPLAVRQSAPPAPAPVPVVRPHPPGSPRPGGAAVPVQRLAMPVVPEAGAPAAGPAPEDDPFGASPPLAVRASRPAPDRQPENRAGRSPQPDPRAQAVQRAVAEAGLAGVPVRVVQKKPAPGAASTGPAAPAAPAVPTAPRPDEAAGVDVEDLARRLIDPVSRLLRADLRRGRERSGRPYDGRR
ncbi:MULTISPECIES: hypothetical protein [unclassified Streptomyces]|uniref:hypothetical protein n=1 Tax=unclassified Streptomyces TaxID=2593676 RepID=UPI0009961CBA|nr:MULTISPECIES: hypothetical protein [unclassified Streptomyces]MYY00920.1 hypothetical protein [Streptomyces sp. SID4913]